MSALVLAVIVAFIALSWCYPDWPRVVWAWATTRECWWCRTRAYRTATVSILGLYDLPCRLCHGTGRTRR